MASAMLAHLSVSARPWLMLPIDYKTREFDGKALLALEAADRGWGVLLSRKAPVRTERGLPSGVVIERAIAPGLAKKMELAKDAGRRVVAWCDEGLVYLDAAEYRRRKVDPAAYDLVEHFFAWGQNHADDVHAAVPGAPDKVRLTGNPRFDLHRPEYRGIYDAKVAELKGRYGDFILVNTKFSKHNGVYSLEDTVKLERRAGVVQTDEDEEHLRGWGEFHRIGFEAFRELIGKLRQAFPDRTIVVRPHPSERREPWLELAAGLPNVVVDRDGNVVEWLLAAAVSIHNNCTTGVEAYLLGRPSISYRPVSDPRYDMLLPNALTANAFTIEETLRLCRKALETGAIGGESADADRIARHFVANIKGPPSTERIMNILEKDSVAPAALSRYYGRFLTLSTTLLKRVMRLPWRLMGQVKAEKIVRAPGETLRLADVTDFLAAAQRATGRFAGIEVVEFMPETICIYRRRV